MSTGSIPPLRSLPVWDLPRRLDLAVDIEQLRQFITTWVEESDHVWPRAVLAAGIVLHP